MFQDSVRQFKKEDFPKLAGFVKKQFHEKYILSDEKFFEWQYKQNPHIDDYSFFLLEQGDKIYGYIGMAPVDFKIGDGTVRLNTYANLFTDERVRGLGLGTLLIKKAMEQGSPALVEGYNKESFSIYKKHGEWKEMGDLHRYVYIVDQSSIKKFLPNESISATREVSSTTLPKNPTGLSFEFAVSFDKSYNRFWKRIRNRYTNTVERTTNYMDWRFANHPYLEYKILTAKKDGEIAGYIIYRVETSDGFSIARIVDFVSEEETEADILTNFLQEVSTRVDMVDFMFSGDYYHTTLKKLGFFNIYGTLFEKLPMYFNPISYKRNFINFIVWQDNKSIDKNTFYNHNNWYLTKADGDMDRPNPH